VGFFLSYWLQNLNPEQQAAVSHNHGPLLILAGAGSGKTTVLVSRTGRLIAEGLTKPHRVCVLTFTNKAAHELKIRVAKKLGAGADKVWAGTFHGFGLQFLKEHWKEAQLPKRFGVIDASDAQAIVKDLLRDHKAYEKARLNVDALIAKIAFIRENGRDNEHDDSIESAASIILAPKFVSRLRQLGVVDFEELLLRPLRMMKESSIIREKMQKKFDFVMVDEFQDTNSVQMKLIDELTASHRNIAVVGDDDQSIYGWRGAEIQNILGFPKRYKNCEVIRLERNYRSTSKILDLANAIIASNKARHTKVLKPSAGNTGEIPELFVFENEDEEVDQVINELSNFQKQGYKWKDIAVLYRSNSQGGLMEGGLRRSGIPYKLTGGTALFDRKESKDVLAFIRSSVFPSEVSFRRIINLPARGVGEKTIEAIEEVSEGSNLLFHQKARIWAKSNSEEKASQAILDFFTFLENLKVQLCSANISAEEVLNNELRILGYREYVQQSYVNPQAVENRWLSVTLVGRILDGMFNRHGRSLDTLDMFINCMELRDPVQDAGDEQANEVQMMTLHACKGLEFPLVFLLGLEEDLLPHARLGQNTDEERRLFYVGVTRAKKHLVLTRVRQRKRYGRHVPVAPSRFLLELNDNLYKEMHNGRPMESGVRESMLADLYAKLNLKIAERDAEK